MTDTAQGPGVSDPRLRVVPIALLIAGAVERFLADGSIGDLY